MLMNYCLMDINLGGGHAKTVHSYHGVLLRI